MVKRILVVKNKQVVCDYWSSVLADAGYQPVKCWTTADDLLRAVADSQPDLLLTESGFADGQGFETARRAIAAHPPLRCIVSLPPGMGYYPLSLRIDISGYLPQDMADPEELLRCLDQISQGYRYISPVFWGALRAPTDAQIELVSGLSERRKQVLRLVARGLTARQIGLEMGIKESTVRNHKEDISKLLGLKGVYELKTFSGTIAHLLD